MAGKALQVYAPAHGAKILGGVEPLARRLGISQAKLKLYLENLDTLPQALFVKIVDVSVDDQTAEIAEKGAAPNNGSQERTAHGGDVKAGKKTKPDEKKESSRAYFERLRPKFLDWRPPTEEEKALEVKARREAKEAELKRVTDLAKERETEKAAMSKKRATSAAAKNKQWKSSMR